MNIDKKPFRVLCLDGGGMRGLYTASVLETLAQRFHPEKPIDIGKGFDLIVGTSTGGILACGLVAGIPVSKIIEIYRKHGPRIFSNPIPRNMLLKLFWAIWNINHPANKNEHLRSSLNDVFSEVTLGDIFLKRGIGLCIPSIDLATHKPKVFKTAHDRKRNADDKRQLVDLCLATSAAPIILPIASVRSPHASDQVSHYVDGGLWANNPVLVGLIEALQTTKNDQRIEVISIGTCPPPSGAALLPREAHRGVLGWNFGVKALELSMDAQASGHQYMARFLVEYLKCHRQVELLRLEQSAPSPEQALYLSLDNASERACSMLVELATSDALNIYGKAISSSNRENLLEVIFKSMPILECKETK